MLSGYYINLCTIAVETSVLVHLYLCNASLIYRYLKLESEIDSLSMHKNNEKLLHLMKKLQTFEDLDEIRVQHLKVCTPCCFPFTNLTHVRGILYSGKNVSLCHVTASLLCGSGEYGRSYYGECCMHSACFMLLLL